MITGILIILFWIVLIPFGVGMIFTSCLSDKQSFLMKSYLFGLMVYLGLFQVIIVSNMLTVNDFFKSCKLFSAVTIILAFAGIVISILKKIWKKDKMLPGNAGQKDRTKQIEMIVLRCTFGVVFVFQLIQTMRLTFPDGDDAYYVGVATYGVNVPQMYSRIPYTGEYTGFDTRHCLAPFPYLISFLGRMSQIPVATIAHSILPVCFLLFFYGIYLLIAKELCKEKREIPLFMLLISILLIFGNYSVYSMETFLMTRIRQGKASLGSFALPAAVYLLFLVAKELDGSKKKRFIYYFLLGCNGLAAALFTTMGNFIYPCLVLFGSICICFGKKDWKKIIPLALACAPSGMMAVLYLLIR